MFHLFPCGDAESTRIRIRSIVTAASAREDSEACAPLLGPEKGRYKTDVRTSVKVALRTPWSTPEIWRRDGQIEVRGRQKDQQLCQGIGAESQKVAVGPLAVALGRISRGQL
jgi:hypothetical protein